MTGTTVAHRERRAMASHVGRRLRCALTVTALALLPAGCSDPVGPMPTPAAPHLGLVPNPSDFTYADSLGSAILTARALGATMVQLGELWSTLETSPGAIDVAGLRAALPLFRAIGLEPYFNLRVLDTNNRGVPADLSSVAFDDPQMIARADAMVDTLIALARVTPLLAFSFGNEVDVYLSQHPAELPAFRALLQRQRSRIRAALPGLEVGCCTTSPVANAAAWVGDTLNAYTDIAIYTYYPFIAGSDFIHRPPATFEPDMAAMLARAGGRPMGLQEVGYTSSPVNGSSPAAQAETVRRFRAYMASASRDRIRFASWFLMTDWSSATLSQLFSYYGVYSPGFGAFLGNLGLRDSVGTPKPAWAAWRGPP